ncbi:polyprenyl synthetase family protein [Thalassospira marina]|uniref:Farnesyl-diphosphate synthase n=1 Tax=Thalassospira marina TaxID=2048283 RepID=A0A2N3KMI3_9PROT|nr:farnesyl diphosphate synthase [Thalassospira marina]PKR51765.1 farnesyl-diphosphate synthase [Thalassospira marina]
MLDKILPRPDGQIEERLFEAMRYSTMGEGKRLRPFLVMASSGLFKVSRTSALRVAAAIEMVHTYSLIHDDLPAMDNDDLRRGKPSCHKQFDEATAILAGDALLTQAFEVLADEETHPDPRVCTQLVRAMARAAGPYGMVGGQMIDLAGEGQSLSETQVTHLHLLKTGRMFAFACEAGAILGKAPTSMRMGLRAYAHDMGLAFQIKDDLLDVEASSDDLGKTAGKDAEQEKSTYVKLLGLEQAREQAQMLCDQAIHHLDAFDGEAEPLRAVARFVIDRKR